MNTFTCIVTVGNLLASLSHEVLAEDKKDEIADVQNLDMWLDVNGERKQTGNTRTMIFTVAQVISHLSQLMTLHPGDVISTGTPPGVAFAQGYDHDGFLKPGDVMDVWIEGLGQQTQTVKADT